MSAVLTNLRKAVAFGIGVDNWNTTPRASSRNDGSEASLSYTSNLPQELWLEVFAWVMHLTQDSEPGRLGETWCQTLRVIRSVSRSWNAAALAHCELWRVLPPMDFRGSAPFRKGTYGALHRRIRVYLQRAGTLRVSFHFKAFYESEGDGVQALETLGILTEASARWGRVKLWVPLVTLKFLGNSGIERPGRLDRLWWLELVLLSPDTVEEECTEISIGLFKHAGMLKHVVFNSLDGCSMTPIASQVVFKMDIAWGQLETFQSRTHRDWGYHKLLQKSEAKITTLKYTSSKINSLPSTHVTLQDLTLLHLHFGAAMNRTAYLNHLDTLTLPRLEDLKIRGTFRPSDPLYPKVIALLRRSGCDLKQLALDYGVEADFEDLDDISALCQNLWHLDMKSWHMDRLGALELDVHSPRPLFPKLGMLTLRIPIIGRSAFSFQRIIDPAAFMRMVQSRTEALAGVIGGDSDNGDVFKPLKEVRLIYDWEGDGLWSQVKAFEEADPSLAPGFGPTNPAIVKALQTFKKLVIDFGKGMYRDDSWAYAKLPMQIHDAMSGLEELDLGSEDSRVLAARWGILHMLHQMSTGSRTLPTGQAIFGIRKRAKELCNKWEPFLLRDSRSAPYRWCYLAEDMAKLKYVTPLDDDSPILPFLAAIIQGVAMAVYQRQIAMVYLDKCLLWHPRRDNKFIVGGNSQITLYEWAAEYPEIRHITSQHDLHFMKCFAWSPDPAFEDLLAIGHSTGKVDLIRLEASKQARQSNILTSGPTVTLPVRNSRACNALAFCTPDPNYLAVGLDKIRNDSSLIIWDINAARAGLTLHGGQGGEAHVSLVPPITSRPHPQIPRIDNRADTRTLQQHGPIMLQQHAPTEVVSSLSFLPHSTHLLLAGVSNRWLRLFDLRSSTPSVTNVASKVHGIATDTFDPHRIACFGDNQVTIWDARRLSQPLLMFTERDGLGDGAKLRQGAAYSHIEFSRTRRGCLSTLERDGSYVRFWDVTETRHPSSEGSVFGGSSDGEGRTGRESSRSARRSWANLPWPSQNSNAARSKDSPTLPERQPYASYVLADTRRTKTFSRPLASFAMVPDSSHNPLACHVMVVNKDGDLELYQVHDTPKQGAWSSLGDLTVGAGKGFKVFEGFRNHDSADSDGVRQPPTRLLGEKDPSRSRSATRREDRGRPSHLYPPPSSALFGDHEGFPPISGVSAQLAMSARGGKPRTYSPLGKLKAGERSQSRTRSGVPVAGIKRFTESRSRERRRSPSAAGRKSSKGPELKSKGITSVLAEDISMVMHKRAMIGYGLSKPHENMLITENPTDPSDSSGQDLSEVWAWIYHSRELLCSPTPRVHGYDFSYQGLIGIWEGFQPSSPSHSDTSTSVDDTPTVVNRSLLLDIPGAGNQHERTGSSRRSHSPADDLHGNWAAALTTIAERRGVDRSLWKPPVPTTKLVQRQVALQLCGWSLKDEELKTAVKRWEREGKLTRAACWLVFTKQHTRAIDLLMQSTDPSHQMMSGTIAALLPHSSSALKNPELRQHYSQLTARVKDPYLKMMLTHMAVGDWAEVLKENKIPFRERLAIAFQFLDDKSVTSALRRMTEAAYQQGDIEGLIITGLTKSGLNILQAYVDKTGDVQTAAIMSSYVCPVRFKDSRAEKWLQTYRDLLDGFKLHHERVGFDIERGQLLSDAIQNGFMPSEEWVPRQILIRCHYCNKAVNGAEMLHPNQFPQKGRPTTCPNCSRALPKCSVCLMTLGIVNDASRELELGYSHFKDTIDDAIVICQTCRHGGHAGHILEWFLGEDGMRAHGVCPVAGCDCRCADEF